MIVASIFAVALGGELLIPVFEALPDVLLAAFEPFEMIFHTMYEKLGMDDYSAQTATAWTAALIYAGLAIWLLKKLYRKYQRAKAAAPHWWENQKSDFKIWWKTLNWKQKLTHIASCLFLLGILVLFI